MSKPPLISVLLPTHNCSLYVNLAIGSILNQSLPDFELLIYDDASDDKSLQVIKRFADSRVRIFQSQKQVGISNSLNFLLSQAKGRFIARMDADDIATTDRLEKQAEFLNANPEIALCGAQAILINSLGKNIGKRIYPTNPETIKKVILRYNPVIHPTWFARINILAEVGIYDPNFDGAEDYELLLRIAKKFKVANLPKALIYYRIASHSISLREMKKVELASIKTKIKAIFSYDYSKANLLFVFKDLLMYFLPKSLKIWFLKNLKNWQ